MKAPDANTRSSFAPDEAVFQEPWEARAFAIAVKLHESGLFGWDEWANVLAQTIREQPEDMPYYKCWLIALETLLSQKSLISGFELESRKREWQEALAATPHGQPVELANARAYKQGNLR